MGVKYMVDCRSRLGLWWSIKQGAHLAMSTRAFIGWNIVGWGGLALFDSIVFHTCLGLPTSSGIKLSGLRNRLLLHRLALSYSWVIARSKPTELRSALAPSF